jgi:hypothetical protein
MRATEDIGFRGGSDHTGIVTVCGPPRKRLSRAAAGPSR